ncbi:flavodoxin [[Clostridium] leptum]|nr:flavodoxin [[Clostridium] leptum]
MKNIQKLGSLLLAALMILSLTACGSKASNDTPTQAPSNDTSTPAQTLDDAAGDSDSTTSGGKVLVVYYSASGNTKRVAEDIAEAAGGNLFEIYTSDDLNWTNSDSRVSREHDDESLRDVPLTTTEVENWDDYDTVFIGYPIWWGIAAWPVDNFVKNNDFTGKTVIPFATSSSSGMGQSGILLSEMAGTGDWQDGQRFSSGASSSTVRQWVTGLGLS